MTPPNQSSRRSALAMMSGLWLREAHAAEDWDLQVRMGISDSQMEQVNLNDARAAMRIWVNILTNDQKIGIDLNGKMVYPSQELLERVRKGELDAVAVNILEYRQIAEFLDSNRIITPAGTADLVQYVILTKRSGPIQNLADLRGRQLRMLKGLRMCVTPAWLLVLLEERHLGSPEQFFGAVTTETKASQVVFPVFFGKADACLTLKRSFDTICELNPQVAKELSVLAASPAMTVGFFIFRKNYRSANREKLIGALSGLRRSAAGRQLNTLFQFDVLNVEDARCLSAALRILDAADSIHRRVRASGRDSK